MATSEFVDDLARRVVARVAPDELPQFESTVRAFNAASWRQRRRAARRNEALGVGVDGVVAMLTIAILYILGKIVDKLADRSAEQAAKTITSRLGGLVRRILRRPKPVAARWNPTREQFVEIRRLVLRTGRSLGLAEAQIKLLTNEIIAELAAGPDVPDPQRSGDAT